MGTFKSVQAVTQRLLLLSPAIGQRLLAGKALLPSLAGLKAELGELVGSPSAFFPLSLSAGVNEDLINAGARRLRGSFRSRYGARATSKQVSLLFSVSFPGYRCDFVRLGNPGERLHCVFCDRMPVLDLG